MQLVAMERETSLSWALALNIPVPHHTGFLPPQTCRQAKTWLFRGCQSNVMHLSVTTATSARSF